MQYNYGLIFSVLLVSTVLSGFSQLGFADTGFYYDKVKKQSFFYRQYHAAEEDDPEQIKRLAQQMAIAAIKKAKLDIAGPLTFVYQDLDKMANDQVTGDIGFPVKGRGQRVAGYKTATLKNFHYLAVKLISEQVQGDNSVVAEAWRSLYRQAKENNHGLTGESRMEIHDNGEFVLQLGITREAS